MIQLFFNRIAFESTSRGHPIRWSAHKLDRIPLKYQTPWIVANGKAYTLIRVAKANSCISLCTTYLFYSQLLQLCLSIYICVLYVSRPVSHLGETCLVMNTFEPTTNSRVYRVLNHFVDSTSNWLCSKSSNPDFSCTRRIPNIILPCSHVSSFCLMLELIRKWIKKHCNSPENLWNFR